MFFSNLTPPWVTFTTPGATPQQASADPTTGEVLASSYVFVAGSAHNWAGVARGFAVPEGTGLLAAIMGLPVFARASVDARLGYSSAEALVTLWLWEPGRPISTRAEHRVSLDRRWAIIYGQSGGPEQQRSVHLQAYLRRAGTEAGFAAAAVFVETWAGTTGIAGAVATSRASVGSMTVAGF